MSSMHILPGDAVEFMTDNGVRQARIIREADDNEGYIARIGGVINGVDVYICLDNYLGRVRRVRVFPNYVPA